MVSCSPGEEFSFIQRDRAKPTNGGQTLTFRLNSRSLDILSLLVASEKPLASKDIARQLNVSSRMVRSSIAPAEPWLREKQITVRKVPGEGFSLIGSERAKRDLTQMIREYAEPLPCLSPAERVQASLLTLFFADSPPQIKQLQEILNVSRTTTIKVLDSSATWLQDYNLELIRRPNFGCMIHGNERDWRNGVVDLIQESAGDARILARLQGTRTVVEISYRTRTGLEDALSKVWSQLDTSLVRKVLLPIETALTGTLSDQACIKLFLHLAVAIYRSRIAKSISVFPQITKDPGSVQGLSKAREIGTLVAEQFGLYLPETEIDWIALQLQDNGLLPPETDRAVVDKRSETDSAIRRIIDQFLIQVSLSLHPSLSVDADLIRNLTSHFETILDPQSRGQIVKNPLIGEVKNQYPYIFSVARQNSVAFKDQLGRELSEVEIGHIAICLIAAMERLRLLGRISRKVMVVCSAGVVTAWLLVSRLRAEFPDVEVVEVISALGLENRKCFDDIDFIVSTVPVRIKNLPSRRVNPLLGPEECKALREMFQESGIISLENKLSCRQTVQLSDLLTSETIELGVAAENWQEVVEKAGARLVERGAIEPKFIRSMKEIILEFGPYMVVWPGVVLLHAPPDGVRELCMGLISLRQPVCFGHQKNDPVQLAIILGAIDNHSHLTALQMLNRMMHDAEARFAIQATLHKSVILHWISRYSNSTEM
jgi:transcriptional antiterminator/mannitol/fructose-specific phosphotransferase system IIA component (Ntr-type)